MAPSKKTPKNVDQEYQMHDLHEQTLKRPGMFMGSIVPEDTTLWICNMAPKSNSSSLIQSVITYVPGMYKIFDEIIVNARDQVIRCSKGKNKCTHININVNIEEGCISVWNNGEGIPVIEHTVHKIYIPSMIFGELLTSSNYDDNQKREVGGTNGLGAKLTNIYSTKFIIETVDSDRGLHFKQTFTDNMYNKGEPIIEKSKDKSCTIITYYPDVVRFGVDSISISDLALYKKRAYDIAITDGLKVTFNGEVLQANNFTQHVDLYFPTDSDHIKTVDITNKKWKVAVVYDPNDKMDHQIISFVNGICTSRGGSHADYVVNQITSSIRKKIEAKNKDLVIKPIMIKENLIFFIDAVIVNPEFDTQTKECLTTKSSKFGSTYTAPDNFLNKILKTGVVEQIISNANQKAIANLNKNTKKKSTVSYEKLSDATHAKKCDGSCTLILTEGDSAKTFALSGLNKCGREKYGVFPLKGKLMNVREKTIKAIAANTEIQAITKIIGLEFGDKKVNRAKLRYGKVMILTDQDVDGSHIKGLIINFIHHFWPSLIKVEDFIQVLATPLLKAFSKGKAKKEIYPFNSIEEFNEWKEGKDMSKWTVKYYKGLGTSTSMEAQECFEDLNKKLIKYYWEPIDDPEAITEYQSRIEDISEDAINLAFAKGREDDRKEWLSTYNENVYIKSDERKISIFRFIHNEFIGFSMDDIQRSIPNLMDGLKPGQRKVLYGCLKRNLFGEETKVVSLGGYITDHAHYHHGDASLNTTIIRMAQQYVGSNNINILVPCGQFGSRAMAGKDYASPRYICTKIADIVKIIYNKNDNPVLEYNYDDGDKIEPKFYAPIICMLLVNGSKGIGTGYSTTIPSYNPSEIVANIRRILNGDNPYSMLPWYRHFTGAVAVDEKDKQKYTTSGVYEILENDIVHITELPINTWLDNYKSFLEALIEEGKTGKSTGIGSDIKSMTETCTEIRVDYLIKFKPGKLKKYIDNGTLQSELKLISKVSTSNMYLFDETNGIKKYNTCGAILRNYTQVRLAIYGKRKEYLLGKLKHDLDILKYKLKFIRDVIAENITVFKKPIKTVIDQLIKNKFPQFSLSGEGTPSYNYLTNIPIYKFTKEEIDILKAKIKENEEEYATLFAKSPKNIWLEELDEFEAAYLAWDAEDNTDYQQQLSGNIKGNKKGKKKMKNAV
jgi:DNA topoisomerase II